MLEQSLRALKRFVVDLGRSVVVTFALAVLGIALGVLAAFDNPVAGAVVLGALILAFGIAAAGAVIAAGEGLYEYTHAEDVWDIEDRDAHTVTLTKTRTVKYLQNEVFAIRDFAWGTGAVSGAQVIEGPGDAVHDYTRDEQEHTIILLDGIRGRRSDPDHFKFRRVFADSFPDRTESVVAEVVNATGRIAVTVRFPPDRPPTSAWLTRREAGIVEEEPIVPRPSGGRQQVTWTTDRPRRFASYRIYWKW